MMVFSYPFSSTFLVQLDEVDEYFPNSHITSLVVQANISDHFRLLLCVRDIRGGVEKDTEVFGLLNFS